MNQRFDIWRMAPRVRLLKIMKLFPAIQSSCIWRIAMVVYWSYIWWIRGSIYGGWLLVFGCWKLWSCFLPSSHPVFGELLWSFTGPMFWESEVRYVEDGSRCPVAENYEAVFCNPVILYLENSFCRLLVLHLENQRFDMSRMAPGVRLLKISSCFLQSNHHVLSFCSLLVLYLEIYRLEVACLQALY